jgi:hypothetical protein
MKDQTYRIMGMSWSIRIKRSDRQRRMIRCLGINFQKILKESRERSNLHDY